MRKIILLTICIISILFLMQPFSVLAAEDKILEGLDYATIAGYGTQDLRVVIARTISAVLGFLGIIVIVVVIWGGFRWMTAGGNEEKVKSAKGILIAGTIGLAIIIMAYAIATFVAYTLADVTGQQ